MGGAGNRAAGLYGSHTLVPFSSPIKILRTSLVFLFPTLPQGQVVEAKGLPAFPRYPLASEPLSPPLPDLHLRQTGQEGIEGGHSCCPLRTLGPPAPPHLSFHRQD